MGKSMQLLKSISRKGFLLFIAVLFSFALNAQTFPVQVSPQLLPPFSGYVPDYASPGNENFRILLLFTDFSQPTYNVKLKIKIQGQGITIQSPAWYYAGPVTLEPGVPSMLSGSDLSDLLNENNLEFTGITRQQYDVRKVLPEGFYIITVIAYDFINPIPIQVSNEGTTQAWMVLNDPPYLNLPSCNSQVVPQTPQQVIFSWTAMNLAAPSSALGSEYIFDLWEIFPANQSPGNIVASTAPLFSITTNQTLLNYGITEPPLVVGRQYVWRVRAHDLENRELFRNNGYSELCTFSYGSNLDLMGNSAQLTLHAQALTSRQARCWWDSLSIYANYRLEFRKASTANWFPLSTTQGSLRISDLEPNTNYEAQVTGITPSGEEGPISNLVNWHTPDKPVFNCGEAAPPPSQQNFNPLTQANTGMIWEIGQFEMVVTSLNGNSNSAGWYSGLGKVVMPLGWTVACSFSGIQVGEDHVVYSGVVNAITGGMVNWLSQYQSNGYPNAEIEVNTEIDNPSDIIVNVLDGEITINGQTYTYEPDEGTAIEDDNGTLWIVTNDGFVIYAGQTGIVFNPPPADHINTNFGVATFSAAGNQLYGFDPFLIQAWRNYYGDVSDVKDGSVDAVAWKSVQSKKYDVVQVHLSNLGTISPDSIFIYSPTGTIYSVHGNGTDKTIYIVGSDNKTTQELYAGFYSGDSIINIGKLNAISFEEQTKNVWLLPIGSPSNTISAGLTQSIKTKLDSIYKGAVIKWNVKTPSSIFSPSNWDKNNDGKLSITSTATSRYSQEENSIISSLKYQSWYVADDEYLFVSSVQPDSILPGVQGEMPRKSSFGFIFQSVSAPNFSHLAAHELSHGTFALEHSFEGNAPAPKNTTNNLLDYNNGNSLAEWQWMWMHNPTGWTGLDEDENGAYVAVDMRELLPFLNSDSSSFTFYSPAGKPISIPKDGLSAVVFSYGDEYALSSCNGIVAYDANPVGSLYAFVLDTKQYIVSSSCSSHEFLGYSIGLSSNYYEDIISKNLLPTKGIIGYPCIEGGGIVFVLQHQLFPTVNTFPNTNYFAGGPIVPHVMTPNSMSLGNSPTTTISAIMHPPYSADAIGYLQNNLAAATCGSGRGSFVLTYAFQINRYPTTYTMCFKEPEVTTQLPNSQYQTVPLPNAYTSIPESTPFQQLDQQLDDLRYQTRQGFYEVDVARRNVNAEIMAINDHYTMAAKLNTISEYTCLFNQLTAQSRIHAISVLCQSTVNGDWYGVGNNYESHVNFLLSSVVQAAQQDSILNELKKNNNALLQTLWSKLDDNALDEFVNTITGWIANSATNKPTFSTLHDQTFISNPNSSPNLTPRYFEFYNWATEFSTADYRFTTQNHWVAGSDNIFLETTYDPNENDNQPGGFLNTTLSAFDWVAIHIGDDIPSLGLKKNQNLVVPMIWAKWLSTRIQNPDPSFYKDLILQVVIVLGTEGVGLLFEALFVATEVGTVMTGEMVGQRIEAFVLQNATKGEIATAEIGADGGWVFKDLRWATENETGVVKVGELQNVKYYDEGNILREGELEVLKHSGSLELSVRPKLDIGLEILGKPIQRIKLGTNGKVAVVGRKMDGHVIVVANELKSMGYDVEIFNASDQINNTFIIDNEVYTWQEIAADFANTDGQYLTNAQGFILDSELPRTLMYKADAEWVDKIIDQQYTILDFGYPSNMNLGPSLFYNMEITKLFP